jgi:hypothetical protein
MGLKMVIALTTELRAVALNALELYLSAPPMPDGRTPVEVEAELDRNRVEVIERLLKPLIDKFVSGVLSVGEFKKQIDSTNKQNQYWGFSGIKGQMFFNMLVKTASDTEELTKQLQASIRAPTDEAEASAMLRSFQDYIARVGEKFVAAGGEAYNKPKAGSVSFFLSYFWQVQYREVWPVFYTNTVQMIEDMNLWEATGDSGEDYLAYKSLHNILKNAFSEKSGRLFTLYDVEHVFWFRSGKMSVAPSPQPEVVATPSNFSQTQLGHAAETHKLPEGYVPPIVSIIPSLASNEPQFQEIAQRSGTTLERAFEKSINAAFTILGFETRLLGQGQGRVPDGQAIAVDESYAVIWDAKARTDGYRMGTDDRTIRQYIDVQSRALKRSRGIRNIYYVIISSGFSDDFDELIRMLKMETNVNEVCLMQASALVMVVDQKLRAPLSVSLGSDGIQRLFSDSGIITPESVIDNLA